MITLVLDKFDPRPSGVYIGPPIIRKGKIVPQIELSEKQQALCTIHQMFLDEIPENTLHMMIRKAWEEGFYDEGVAGSPWFPLLGHVIQLYMFVNSAGQLEFLPGCYPTFDPNNETFTYAEQLLIESAHNITEHRALSLPQHYLLQEGNTRATKEENAHS